MWACAPSSLSYAAVAFRFVSAAGGAGESMPMRSWKKVSTAASDGAVGRAAVARATVTPRRLDVYQGRSFEQCLVMSSASRIILFNYDRLNN